MEMVLRWNHNSKLDSKLNLNFPLILHSQIYAQYHQIYNLKQTYMMVS